MHKSIVASITPLLLLIHVALASAQATPPPAPPPPLPPPPVAPAAQPPAAQPPAAQPPAAGPSVTADALLGLLQREATNGGGACALSTTYRIGERLAIGCGASGVWIAQINPDSVLSLVIRQHFGAPVVRLFEGGGRLWAELQGGAAIPVDPNATTSPSPPPASAVPGSALPQSGMAPIAPAWSPPPPAPPLPRVADVWEVAATIRPFLALETLGGGAVIEAEVGYRFHGPVHTWAALQPSAIASGKDSGTIAPYAALGMVSFDMRAIELGLGVGMQSFFTTSREIDAEGNPVAPGSALTISQFVRFGHRDRLTVSVRSDIALFHQEFELSNVFVHGQLPLRSSQGLWIIANGGGGQMGYALGEVGLRSRLRGDESGGPGSVFLTVTIGGVSVFKSPVCIDSERGQSHCSDDYSGPLFGLGTEWRL